MNHSEAQHLQDSKWRFTLSQIWSSSGVEVLYDNNEKKSNNIRTKVHYCAFTLRKNARRCFQQRHLVDSYSNCKYNTDAQFDRYSSLLQLWWIVCVGNYAEYSAHPSTTTSLARIGVRCVHVQDYKYELDLEGIWEVVRYIELILYLC